MAKARLTTFSAAAVLGFGLAAGAAATLAQGQLSALRTGEVRQGPEALRVDDYIPGTGMAADTVADGLSCRRPGTRPRAVR